KAIVAMSFSFLVLWEFGLRTKPSSPLPLRERVDRAQRETGEGSLSFRAYPRSATPHPALRATFSLKRRRKRETRTARSPAGPSLRSNSPPPRPAFPAHG